ncbi:MAG: hypothetical protein CMIDDMOC_00894 [Sodalis sp. Fle]|nr:MAG: hypothetical protein CMIDDMOC_00894 [Sodalis sp. Fle]
MTQLKNFCNFLKKQMVSQGQFSSKIPEMRDALRETLLLYQHQLNKMTLSFKSFDHYLMIHFEPAGPVRCAHPGFYAQSRSLFINVYIFYLYNF